ncbi:MAG TPA: hypothetical protein PLD34_00010 [Pseudothermotoga sp.]|nr:hypothetical protein [Pseudothermotoga sp.]
MDFGKKLGLLMNVLGITNNTLAKMLSVDPSLVSRWRSGSRIPARDSQYIEMIASCLVDRAKMEHQKLAICEITGCVPETLEKAKLEELVKRWLSDGTMPDTRLIGGFLNKVGLFKMTQQRTEGIEGLLQGQNVNFEVFYSNEGKQRGVMKFLSYAFHAKEPGTLLLYSDESVDWFVADKSFALHLGGTMIELAKNGWKINMVHTMSRDISEMLAAIDFWLPLYMTGSVTPYYNPRYREHYFRKTLFVIPTVVAFTCSVFEEFRHSVNLLVTERQIVELLEQEYRQFLDTCRPLMRIPQIGSQEMFTLLEDFEEQTAPCFVITDGLPLVTMPEEVLEKVLRRNEVESEQLIMSHWRKRSSSFERNVKDNSCVHIITLPDPSHIKSQKVPVELPETDRTLFYSAQEYAEHLRYLLYLIKKYENYHLCISPKSANVNVYTTVKDQVGVIVFKKDSPMRLFAINHPDMTNAFFCYAEDFMNKLPLQSKNREQVVKALVKLVEELKRE